MKNTHLIVLSLTLDWHLIGVGPLFRWPGEASLFEIALVLGPLTLLLEVG